MTTKKQRDELARRYKLWKYIFEYSNKQYIPHNPTAPGWYPVRIIADYNTFRIETTVAHWGMSKWTLKNKEINKDVFSYIPTYFESREEAEDYLKTQKVDPDEGMSKK